MGVSALKARAALGLWLLATWCIIVPLLRKLEQVRFIAKTVYFSGWRQVTDLLVLVIMASL